jgi:hypothetical protein
MEMLLAQFARQASMLKLLAKLAALHALQD